MKLLVIVNNHNCFGILDLCEALRRRDPVFDVRAVCTSEFFSANAAQFEKRGIVPHDVDGHADMSPPTGGSVFSGIKMLEEQTREQHASAAGLAGRIRASLARFVFGTSAYGLAREWRIVRRLGGKQKRALALLGQLRPDVVLSLSDRSHDYVEGAVLWAARQRGIAVVLPYVAQFDIDASVTYRCDKDGKPLPELRPFHPFSLYKLWTYLWLRDQIYKGIFFQAPFILNAARRRGTLSQYPWSVGNGLSDVVCADSRHTMEQYREHRVPEEKIAIVGHVQYDSIFQSHRQRPELRQSLLERYHLAPEKALLVMSVPQYAEQGYMSWADHWREIDDIVSNASKAGHNLLLSVHPRCDITQYRYLAERYDCSILAEPLADVIGAADMFLASNSTTFAWSVLCGIPTIALKSPVRFLFGRLKSIRQVDDSNAIPDAIADLISGDPPSFEEDWHNLSRDLVFDGRYNERFSEIIRQAVSSRTVSSKFR